MAVAGKAAITLEGAWSSTKDYDRLTGVVHNNNLYISRKKPPIGTAPSEGEYWMLCIEGVNEQDLDALAERVRTLEQNYFPKTGGQIEGNVNVRNADNGFGQIMKNNSANADYGTNFVDYDKSGKYVKLALIANQLRAILDFNGEQYDVATLKNLEGYLKLTGGVITGETTFKKALILDSSNGAYGEGRFYKTNETGDASTCIADHAANGDISTVQISALEKHLRYTCKIDGTTKYYALIGEHNKPFGSYTGNGSASARTISTGGIGRLLLVYKEGSDVAALVTPQGAFIKNLGEADGTQAASAYFVNGNFYIATTSAYFNQSGATYYYQVI